MKLLLQGLVVSCGLILTFTQVGCVSESESLYEVDHVTPDHWPASLADAADKLRSRLSAIREQLARPGVDYAAVGPQIDSLAERLMELHQQLEAAARAQAEKNE